MGGNAAAAGLLGAGAGLGLVLAVTGLGRTDVPPWPKWRHLAGHAAGLARPGGRLRMAGAMLAAAVAAMATRWPVGTLLAGIAAWWLPGIAGPDRDHHRQVAQIEAIASWAESLRDTLAAATGLEQALLATQPVAPEPIRDQVTALAVRMRQGERLPAALREFAADLADPTGDLVVAALLLAAQQQASDLGQLLGNLAETARAHAGMRMRIAAGRARVRTAVRIIITATVALVLGLLVFSRAFLQPYDSAAGQLVLAMVGALFAGAFWLLRKIARFGEPQRFLTQLAALGRPHGEQS
jgi:tight adherence protein B